MSSNKRYLYASIILGVVLVITVLFIYFSSAKFIDKPEIHLPSENFTEQQKIEYENQQIVQDVTINVKNYKEIIEKLTRLQEYSMSVLNEIYAYDVQKSQVTSVTVTEESTIAIRDNVEYKVIDDSIYITKGEQTTVFDRIDLTNDEVIGIPSYEDILQISGNAIVEMTDLNGEQALRVEYIDAENLEAYTISLVSGMLMKYEIYEQGILVRNVEVTNLVVNE
ncbi:MAG: hypothetical protein R3Y09_00875 [Clostridia bacterium]